MCKKKEHLRRMGQTLFKGRIFAINKALTKTFASNF